CVAARHVVVRGRLVALFALFPVVRAGLFAFLDGEPDAGAVLADRGVWLADRADVLVDHGPGRLVRRADRTAREDVFLERLEQQRRAAPLIHVLRQLGKRAADQRM